MVAVNNFEGGREREGGGGNKFKWKTKVDHLVASCKQCLVVCATYMRSFYTIIEENKGKKGTSKSLILKSLPT